MRKIRIMEHVSLDGVMQQENDDAFAFAGWSIPYRSPAGLDMVLEAQGNPFDLVLGRRTYDSLSEYWPKAGDSPAANRLNAATKYVATHRPESLAWGPAAHLGADLPAGIRALKASGGPDLVLWGSSTLIPVLYNSGLVDEVVLMVYPVLLGRGRRFFSDTADPRELAFVSSKVSPTGVLINTYRYVGALRTPPRVVS